ncbi:MAG: flagellar biosynthesis protein FlhB [Clostridiales bacterium]|nr:flagellar biosynthesis protein FlhB [Clostridiales bacterium]
MIKYEQLDLNNLRLSYKLQFFADGPEKTEEPTAKKLRDARKEGQVAKSMELITASGLATLFIVLKVFTGYFGNRFIDTFKKYYQIIDKYANSGFSTANAEGILGDGIKIILITCLPVFAAGMLVSFVVVLFQVKWMITPKLLTPKLSKISVINGFKRIFSKEKIVNLVIELIKIAVICIIAYNTLKKEWKSLFLLYDMDLQPAIILVGNLIIDLGLKISLIFLVIGLGDFLYQKIKFKKEMMMTKEEIKKEMKEDMGDPLVKSRIRSKMREVSMRRMMQSLPKADVVITNPTHLAAAIKYERDVDAAPVLIAKGADYLAEKIKQIAKDNDVPIVENKPLARMLYYNVEIGDQIPQELYQMTAEVLAYVYSLKNKVIQ